MAELYHWDRLPGESEPEHAASLPGIGRLELAQRAHLLSLQVAAGLEQLGQGTLAQEERKNIDTEIGMGTLKPAALKDAVLAVHMQLLTMLTAADASTGAAYSLGRALAETMLVPATDQPDSFPQTFDVYRIRTLQEWLANLDGAFPPYAAQAVAMTLTAWSRWSSTLDQRGRAAPWTSEQKRSVGQCLRRQGQMWYGLLTGAIEPTHLLGPDEYAKAAQALMRRVGGLAGHFLIRTWIGWLLTLLIVGLGTLLWWVLATGHLGAVAGTTALLLGAVGVTTGSVATSVAKVLKQAQAPLWTAELTHGIAAAATVLPK